MVFQGLVRMGSSQMRLAPKFQCSNIIKPVYLFIIISIDGS